MASMSCDVCYETFSEGYRIPKLVDCGHTFCSVCLEILLRQYQKICPTCKTPLTKKLKDYPTNFILFRKDENTTCTRTGCHVTCPCSFKKIENEFTIRMNLLEKSIRERTTLKSMITNNITRVNRLLKMDPNTSSTTEAENLNSKLKADLDKVDALLFCCDHPNFKPTYSLSTCISTKVFLYDLANRLHKREKIYAYEMVDSKVKYGRITLCRNSIDIHALDLSSIDKNSSVISFQDLRKCVTKSNFRTFITMGAATLYLTIIDSSFLAFRFISLCSGETGPMFKGVRTSTKQEHKLIEELEEHEVTDEEAKKNYDSYNHHNFYNRPLNEQRKKKKKVVKKSKTVKEAYKSILMKTVILNNVETNFLNHYNLNLFSKEKETTINDEKIIVEMFPEGPCKIHRCISKGLTCKNAVAKVTKEDETFFPEQNDSVITDSGISLIYDEKISEYSLTSVDLTPTPIGLTSVDVTY